METYWYWLISGTILIILEALAPVAYFLWFGVSAMLIAFIVYLYPPSLLQQTILFGILSVVITYLGRKFIPIHIQNKHDQFINRKTSQLIGKTITLSEAISDGKTQVKVDETLWNVKGPNLPKGTQVKIVDVNNNHLIIEEVK